MITTLLHVLTPSVHATTFDVDFCVTVDIAYDDLSGDRWGSDQDKPARGFFYSLSTPFNIVDTGFLEATGGANDGCTGEFSLLDTEIYNLWVYSYARMPPDVFGDPQLIYALDEVSGDTVGVGVVTGYTPVVDTTEFPSPLPGSTEDRFNHLALVTAALTVDQARLPRAEDAFPGNWAIWVYSNDDCNDPHADGTCAKPGDLEIFANGSSRKFMMTHLLGHLVTWNLNQQAETVENWPFSASASEDNCDGGESLLTKEYSSFAAMEGVADFYGAEIWNNIATAGCTYQNWYDLDWNLDGVVDTTPTQTFTCEGDPYDPPSGPDPVNAKDWLEDLVAFDDDDTDALQCSSTLQNRSTAYDWMKYAWDMSQTINGGVESFWELIEETNVSGWRDDDVGGEPTPDAKIENMADILGFQTEHDAAEQNGQDH